MLSLILAMLVQASATPPTVEQIRPVRSFGTADSSPVRMSFAHDGQYEYLATPEGLYRSRRIADPNETATVIAFADRPVHDVVAGGGYLYVLVGNGTSVTSPDPVLMRSSDQGQTFVPLDTALRDCSSGTCRYLVGHHLEIVPGAIFAELGGNLLVTRDEGQHWSQLYGTPVNGAPDVQMCPLVFTILGASAYLGSECPLDDAWISVGRLTANLTSWDAPPSRLPIGLENRNVQFIDAGSSGVYAGVEGGLLHDFHFEIQYGSSGASRYPYIREFVETPQVRLAGGFDKRNFSGYLAVESWSWIDVSRVLPPGTKNVTLLAEASDGTLLIGLQDDVQYTIGVIDVGPYMPKRRAVRR